MSSSQSVFENIFETTLRCKIGEVHETILLVIIGRNFQLLTSVTNNSILDVAAPKFYFILICFCLKWLLQNIMFIRFIPKNLSN